MNIGMSGMALFVAMGTAGVAGAQEPEAGAEAGTEEASAEAAPSEEAPAVEEPAAETTEAAAPVADATPSGKPNSADGGDGARFRFGISGGALALFGAGSSFPYGGADLRLGVQVNDMIGVYAQPQLGFYGGNTAAGFGTGGLVGASAVVDFTFVDRVFVGAGFGYAVLNNPSGPELHFRLGGYPLAGRSSEKVRRKGLMVGADLRFYFLDGATFTLPTLNLGYEAF